jgi:hypothetical protein
MVLLCSTCQSAADRYTLATQCGHALAVLFCRVHEVWVTKLARAPLSPGLYLYLFPLTQCVMHSSCMYGVVFELYFGETCKVAPVSYDS